MAIKGVGEIKIVKATKLKNILTDELIKQIVINFYHI